MPAYACIDTYMMAGNDLESGRFTSIDEIITEMNRRGVIRAFLGAYDSIYFDMVQGNAMTRSWANAFPERIEPVAIINPAAYHGVAEYLEELRKRQGFSLLGLVATNAFNPVDWSAPAIRHILEHASKLGFTLIAGIHAESQLSDLCRVTEGLVLPVIVRFISSRGYQMMASIMALSLQRPEFYFETASFCTTEAISLLAQKIGSDRLVFSSGYPSLISDCAQYMFTISELDNVSKEQIAWKNVKHILQYRSYEPPPSGYADYNEAVSAILSKPKIDIHWHPDTWNLGESYLDPVNQIHMFDKFSYEKVIVFSTKALRSDLRAGNEDMLRWCELDERIYFLLVVSGRDVPLSLDLIRQYVDHPRCVGFKTIQDYFGEDLSHPFCQPILEELARHKSVFLLHMPGLASIASRYPEITFIAAHANYERVIAHGLQDCSNVCFDFSTSHAKLKESQLGRFIDLVGYQRVLFGSDGPLISPGWSLAKLSTLDLEESVLNAILYQNAYRIFSRL
jgi:predicted TIM-barrel fold metal-dependent hydrolase